MRSTRSTGWPPAPRARIPTATSSSPLRADTGSVPDTDHEVPSPAALHDVLLDARRAGFRGPGRIDPHLEHAAGFVDLARRQPVPSGTGVPHILDLGSGGGRPPVAIATRWAG